MDGAFLLDMAETTEDELTQDNVDAAEDSVAKPRLKITMPSPVVYFYIGPFILVFIIYVLLTKLLLTSDLQHEAKVEELLKMNSEELVLGTDQPVLEVETMEAGTEEGGFLDTHNYFQFPMAFAVNIPETNKNLTFELAVSSFQSGVTAEWFFESFTAFVPALRSDILYFMGKHSLEELQSSDFQAALLLDLKDVINAKLESLGSKPDISKVLFIRFVIT